jgi:hypothetical protein
MEAANTSETLGKFYEATRRYSPQDSQFQIVTVGYPLYHIASYFEEFRNCLFL